MYIRLSLEVTYIVCLTLRPHTNKITLFSQAHLHCWFVCFYCTRMHAWAFMSEAFLVKVVTLKSVGYQVRGQFT